MGVFFTADQHFGHKNIIEYCNRPFSDVEEMNEALIENWNKTVDNNDKIFVLGDFALGSSENIIKWGRALKGNKMLILGNHDRASKSVYLEAGFKEVSKYPIVWNQRYILSHAPIWWDEKMPFTSILNMNGAYCFNVHGHIHDNPIETDPTGRCCVCVERTDYKPLKEIKVWKQVWGD